MNVEQRTWRDGSWSGPAGLDAELVLVFGDRDTLEDQGLEEIQKAYPKAKLAGCSTAGEIAGVEVHDATIVTTALQFAKASCKVAQVDLADGEEAAAAGARLAASLPRDGLVHVLVFSDGIRVNGSALVMGMEAALPEGVALTGGLAGDRDRFQRTLVIGPHGATEGGIVAVGLYGPLRVGFGSLGGWDPFGPTRRVTKSAGNVLYELDGQPALRLYKEYLGKQATGLPATGLLFPLDVIPPGKATAVTRTILAVDEAHQSLTFAGDVPEGSSARLMKANFDRLVDGAQGAATDSRDRLGSRADVALLISCVGRKLVLKQRTEEELEAVHAMMGDVPLCGFYSYGEICPTAPEASCELHNQTMTITSLREG